MVDKILSTFSFKRPMNAVYLMIGGLLISCSFQPTWIRQLPNHKDRVQMASKEELLPGIYLRPSHPKSPIKSKQDLSDWTEWIIIGKNFTFQKEFRSNIIKDGQTTNKVIIGNGIYSVSGPWILFQTENLETRTCLPLSNSENWKKQESKPCSELSALVSKKPFEHKLLYHFDRESGSLATLVFESGYIEAEFGIAWEVKKPYLEDELFKIIRAKYTKKEFQPHVYYMQGWSDSKKNRE